MPAAPYTPPGGPHPAGHHIECAGGGAGHIHILKAHFPLVMDEYQTFLEKMECVVDRIHPRDALRLGFCCGAGAAIGRASDGANQIAKLKPEDGSIPEADWLKIADHLLARLLKSYLSEVQHTLNKDMETL